MTTELTRTLTRSPSSAAPISLLDSEMALYGRTALRSWWRADIAEVSLTSLGSIPDRKGRVRFTPARSTIPILPTVNPTGGPDSKPCIVANGATNPGNMWAPSDEVYWTRDKPWSVVAVIAAGSVAGAVVGNADYPGAYIQVRTDRRVVVSFDNASALLTAVNGLPASGFFVLRVCWNPDDQKIYAFCNGVSIGVSNAIATAFVSSRLTLFGNTDGAGITSPGYDQKVADLQWWDINLAQSAGDLAILNAYLHSYYPSLPVG